jgi:hypothetical protein
LGPVAPRRRESGNGNDTHDSQTVADELTSMIAKNSDFCEKHVQKMCTLPGQHTLINNKLGMEYRS